MKKQKVGIIKFSQEREKKSEKTPRISEELIKKGFEPVVFYNSNFSIIFNKNKTEVFYKNEKINLKDYLFFIGNYYFTNPATIHNVFIPEVINSLGIPVFNNPTKVKLFSNKRDSLFLLANNKLPVVQSIINNTFINLDQIIKNTPHHKYIAKFAFGNQGYGVSLLESQQSYVSFMEFLKDKIEPINVVNQNYIRHTEDYRLLVIANKVIASMKRKNNDFDFRSNLNKGCAGEKFKPNQKMKNIAIKTAKVLGVDYVAVDMIKNKNEYEIMETNISHIGTKIEDISGINTTEKIIDHCIKRANLLTK
jgi:ribosomal protein S6--L-glutamate ligase